MSQYKVIILDDAYDDLQQILLYLTQHNRNSAIAWQNKFESVTGQLSQFSKMGVRINDKKLAASGFRMFTIEPYLVFYKVYEEDRVVRILRVFHEARDYPNLFGKE